MRNGMACETCGVNFSFFNRKKQCVDCLRYFCSKCVSKRFDKMLSCTSCNLLSQRPLTRSHVVRIRPRDLRQYLLAKKACVRGCIEKEDLIKVMMVFANGINDYSTTENAENMRLENVDNTSSSQSTEINCDRTCRPRDATHESDYVEIQQNMSTDFISNEGPESTVNEQHSVTFREAPACLDRVELSDIHALSELNHLSVKQLKILLSTNRVDYKGCTERSELMDRARRLWEDYRQSRASKTQCLETLNDNLCKVCWDVPTECVFLECGHIACCVKCGKVMSECPICKQHVVRVVRFFVA